MDPQKKKGDETQLFPNSFDDLRSFWERGSARGSKASGAPQRGNAIKALLIPSPYKMVPQIVS